MNIVVVSSHAFAELCVLVVWRVTLQHLWAGTPHRMTSTLHGNIFQSNVSPPTMDRLRFFPRFFRSATNSTYEKDLKSETSTKPVVEHITCGRHGQIHLPDMFEITRDNDQSSLLCLLVPPYPRSSGGDNNKIRSKRFSGDPRFPWEYLCRYVCLRVSSSQTCADEWGRFGVYKMMPMSIGRSCDRLARVRLHGTAAAYSNSRAATLLATRHVHAINKANRSGLSYCAGA